jgi:hypothetical protein
MDMKLLKSMVLVMLIMFVVLVGWLFAPLPDGMRHMSFPLAGLLGIVFSFMGIGLIVQVRNAAVTGKLRRYLWLTGGCAAGILPSVVLHNLVYGLLILLGGEEVWERMGMMDEPVFFLLGVMVLPLGFIVGVVGSLWEWRREGYIS